MDGLWIDPLIMALKKCTPAERFLLARVCFRAAGNGGVCNDSNKDLGDAICGIHPQSVSDMVKALSTRGLLTAPVDKSRANLRQITPRADLVQPYITRRATYKEKADSEADKSGRNYKPNTDKSKEIPDSDYKEKPDSKPANYTEIPDSTIRDFREGSKEIPDSHYKDIENLENSSLENLQQQPASDAGDGDAVGEIESMLAKAEKETVPVTPASGKNPPPVAVVPLPPTATPATVEQVRQKLSESGLIQRYAIEMLKVAQNLEDYRQLVEKFILQREIEAEAENKLPFAGMNVTAMHFRNWLPKQPKANATNTNNQPNRNGASTNAHYPAPVDAAKAGRTDATDVKEFGDWRGKRFTPPKRESSGGPLNDAA